MYTEASGGICISERLLATFCRWQKNTLTWYLNPTTFKLVLLDRQRIRPHVPLHRLLIPRKPSDLIKFKAPELDLATADFVQNTHDQSMNALSNFDYETDSYVVELFRWTVNGSDALTDPATDTFLQGAIPAEEL